VVKHPEKTVLKVLKTEELRDVQPVVVGYNRRLTKIGESLNSKGFGDFLVDELREKTVGIIGVETI
jgi:hypothetical protein